MPKQKSPINVNDPMVKHQRKMRHLRQTLANGGLFYITDCWPWDIKAGCKRLDCPMRSQAIAPVSTIDSYHLECDPVGDLADFLITLKNTTDVKNQTHPL